MDSTLKISPFSSRLLASDDLVFALELSEAWYDQSWPRICISPPPPGSYSVAGLFCLEFSYLRTTELT